MPDFEKEAVAVWKEATAFEVIAGSGHAVTADGRAQLGMSPMEMVLAGLVGCTGADVISILRKKRQDVTGLEVRVKAARAPEPPRVYTYLELTYVVTGHGVEPEAVRRAIELSEGKYCSVSATLRRTAEFKINYEIVEAEPAGDQSAAPVFQDEGEHT